MDGNSYNDNPKNVLNRKSLAFASRIVKLFKHLQEKEHEFILSKQILRSGTSIGANIYESMYAQSTADFISKLHISLKEASETHYWLDLLYDNKFLTEDERKSLLNDCFELIRLLTASIKTSKTKLEQNKTNK